jgi:hypothetical protein
MSQTACVGDPDAVVRAVGKLTEALETIERARGHLYSFHQLTADADLQLSSNRGLRRRPLALLQGHRATGARPARRWPSPRV